jgi:hypothetical protein
LIIIKIRLIGLVLILIISNISLVFCHDNQVADNKMQFNNNEDAKKSLNDSKVDIDSIDNQI